MTTATLFLLFAVLQLIDYELTAGILERGGRELNPLLRRLIDRFGTAALIGAKLGALGLGYVLAYYDETSVLALACLYYVGLALWNWRQARKERG